MTIPDTERPTANPQIISTQEDQPITITFTGYSPDDNSLDFIILDGTPAHGTISTITAINDNSARITYTPNTDYYGYDSISFRVTDGFKTSGTADVSISIPQHTNSVPVSSQDTANIPEDTSSYSIDVLSNDYDADVSFYGDEVFVHSVDTIIPSGGTAAISADSKSILFTPNQNFDGITTLSYVTRDNIGEQSNSAEITIHMVPSFDSPMSLPDTATVGVGSVSNTIDVLSNDSDPDTGDILSISSVDSTTTRGTAQISSDALSILFTPESGFAGQTTLSYTVQDLAGNTADSTTITIDVSPSEGKALYVVSRGSNEIIAFAPDGSFISEHVTDQLSSPWGVAVSPDGNHIYVSSYTTNKILKYDRATGEHIASFTNNAESTRSAESTSSAVAVFAQDKQDDGSMMASLQPQNELLVANNGISYNTLNQDVSSVLVYDDTTGHYIGEFTREQSLPNGLSVDEYTNSVTVTDSTSITHEFVNAAFSGLSSPRHIEFGPDGNLYISSVSNNKVVRLDVTTEQYDDFATSGYMTSPAGLAWNTGDSNLYVVSSGNGKVLKFDGTTGQYHSEFIESMSTPSESVWGSDGNLYVTSSRNNQIWVYDSSANQIRAIDTSADGLGDLQGIAFGPDGNLYASFFSISNKVQKYNPSGNLLDDSFIGNTNNGGLFDPSDLTFADEPVYNTPPVAVDDAITQQATHGMPFTINTSTLLNNDLDADDGDAITVQSVDGTSANGGTVTLTNNIITYTSVDSFTGDDTFSYTITDSTDTDSATVTVTVIEPIITPEGTFVYVIDNYSKELTKFDGDGNYLSTITGFIGPFDVDSDGMGNIYASATNWHKITKYNSNDELTLTIQGVGKLSVLEQNGYSTVYAPHGVGIDESTGDIYSVTWGGFVQKFDSTGTYITHWGEKGSNDGEFKSPNGIAIDSEGNVYVADRLNHRIQKFDGIGNHLLTFGEKGRQDGQFSWPSKISINDSNNLYVADSDNDRIQKFDVMGNHLLTITMPTDDPLDWVADIDTDDDENIYAIDQRHYRIVKFDSSGNFVDSWAYGSFDKMIGIAVVG